MKSAFLKMSDSFQKALILRFDFDLFPHIFLNCIHIFHKSASLSFEINLQLIYIRIFC